MENLITDDPVLVGEKRRDKTALDDGRSFLTGTSVGADKSRSRQSDVPEDKAQGVNGWTKVKSRSDDKAKIPK